MEGSPTTIIFDKPKGLNQILMYDFIGNMPWIDTSTDWANP